MTSRYDLAWSITAQVCADVEGGRGWLVMRRDGGSSVLPLVDWWGGGSMTAGHRVEVLPVQSGLGLILGGALFYARVTFETLVVFNFKVP